MSPLTRPQQPRIGHHTCLDRHTSIFSPQLRIVAIIICGDIIPSLNGLRTYMYIYLAASRDRHLAIGFRGLGTRVCYAWLDAGWMLAGCWLKAGWMREEFSILFEFHLF
jgi:hypothetical protein